jgi:hypothetical protein
MSREKRVEEAAENYCSKRELALYRQFKAIPHGMTAFKDGVKWADENPKIPREVVEKMAAALEKYKHISLPDGRQEGKYIFHTAFAKEAFNLYRNYKGETWNTCPECALELYESDGKKICPGCGREF